MTTAAPGHDCDNGWLGQNDEGKPIPCPRCKGHLSKAPSPQPTRDTQPPAQRPGVATTPRVWSAKDLQPAQQPRWLARNRIPRAAITVLVGDEGIGKSLYWILIAAAVSTGKPAPELGIPAREPADVVAVITEDDWSQTVRPRLELAGADLDRVYVVCENADGSGSPTFPRDVWLLAGEDRAVRDPALIVVDTWLDTVAPGHSVRDPQQARAALHPWKEAATRTDAAVLLVTHTNRVATGNARDKYGGSAEPRKKARMTLFAQRDSGTGLLLVGPEKSNTSAPVVATQFAVDAVQVFTPTDEDAGTIPRLVYAGESDRTARQHIADAFTVGADDKADRSAAETWLEDYLTQHGQTASKQVKADAAQEGITERTLKRAAATIRVAVESKGFPRITHWSLPPPEPQSGHP